MEILRYKYIFVLLLVHIKKVHNESLPTTTKPTNESTNCPFTKIIEDIFKIHNKTSQNGVYLEDRERAKLFLDSIANVTASSNRSNHEDLVNNIIASINRIKNNITENEDSKLNEAIILNVSNDSTKNISSRRENIENQDEEGTINDIEGNVNKSKPHKDIPKEPVHNDEIDKTNSTEKTMYVEILTIEPNNTSTNNTSNNIIEVLKHLMPMFNTTLNKELHNITIIERNHNKNHSFSASKNISTIVVTFCDNENFTKANVTFDSKETILKVPDNETESDYYFDNTSTLDDGDDSYDDLRAENLTIGEKEDILEAAEYGMQKMHELYSVLEPKLYSMGMWLDDTNPARYVAAFNAPSEDATRYAKYGYASLQAATKLKELTSTLCTTAADILRMMAQKSLTAASANMPDALQKRGSLNKTLMART
ncbi:protein ecdysoneless homolog [Hyposmocoma kahamanoa]|uniref:protein ecdysoneless homolog n=1 Tax=Hyposmocoma kahamanoa TaxID=1477025 RepID=UPI000E6D75FC|nr:protein ecdysoneless homolog [Hyposmocoma kahamanoa]